MIPVLGVDLATRSWPVKNLQSGVLRQLGTVHTFNDLTTPANLITTKYI